MSVKKEKLRRNDATLIFKELSKVRFKVTEKSK